MTMKQIKKKDLEKIQYEQLLKIAEKAQEQADKFIEKNMKMDPQKQVKYSL